MEAMHSAHLGIAFAAVAACAALVAPRAASAEDVQTPAAAPAGPTPQPAPPPAPPAYPSAGYPPPGYGYGPPHPGMMGYGYGGPHHERHFLFGDSEYRSPGLAVALSLQPLPIDFGNLYAENLGWGIAYTAIEVSLMAPMMWIGGTHMGMHDRYDADRGWSDREVGAMVGLVSGYVVVKLVAGLHAGYAARAFNRAYEPRPVAFVVPTTGGAVLGWGKTF